MNRQALLKEMKDSVGTKDPVEFFSKLTDVLNLLFDRIDQLEEKVVRSSAVAVATSHWDSRVASDLISDQVKKLRDTDKDTYANEIATLKVAYAEDKVTQDYETFVKFWEETLGFHPFLDVK